MGLSSYFFTKNVDRTWRLLENLEAGMIGMNTGKSNCNLLCAFLADTSQAMHLRQSLLLGVSKTLGLARNPEKILPLMST